MKKTRLFDIMTLSSNHRLGDPISIITSGIAIINQLFPNLFGGGRKKLTDADWLELIPGSGYWTTALRNHLKSAIHYNNNLDNIQQFTKDFVYVHRSEFSNVPAYPQTINEQQFQVAFTKFMDILEKEKSSGGTSPIGVTPGGIGGTSLDFTSLIPLAVGAVVLVMIMKNKKK